MINLINFPACNIQEGTRISSQFLPANPVCESHLARPLHATFSPDKIRLFSTFKGPHQLHEIEGKSIALALA